MRTAARKLCSCIDIMADSNESSDSEVYHTAEEDCGEDTELLHSTNRKTTAAKEEENKAGVCAAAYTSPRHQSRSPTGSDIKGVQSKQRGFFTRDWHATLSPRSSHTHDWRETLSPRGSSRGGHTRDWRETQSTPASLNRGNSSHSSLWPPGLSDAQNDEKASKYESSRRYAPMLNLACFPRDEMKTGEKNKEAKDDRVSTGGYLSGTPMTPAEVLSRTRKRNLCSNDSTTETSAGSAVLASAASATSDTKSGGSFPSNSATCSNNSIHKGVDSTVLKDKDESWCGTRSLQESVGCDHTESTSEGGRTQMDEEARRCPLGNSTEEEAPFWPAADATVAVGEARVRTFAEVVMSSAKLPTSSFQRPGQKMFPPVRPGRPKSEQKIAAECQLQANVSTKKHHDSHVGKTSRKGNIAEQVPAVGLSSGRARSSKGGKGKNTPRKSSAKRPCNTRARSGGGPVNKGENAKQTTKMPSSNCQAVHRGGEPCTKGETANQATRQQSNTSQARSSDGEPCTKGETANQATRQQSNICQAGISGGVPANKDGTTNQATKPQSNTCQAGISGGVLANKDGTTNQATERPSTTCQAGSSGSGAGSKVIAANQDTKQQSNTSRAGTNQATKRASNTCQAGSSCTEAASKGETANQVTKRHSNTCQAESSGGGAAKDGAANQVTKRASDTCQTGGSDGEASTKGETANQATKIPSNTCQTGSSDGGASTKGETTNQATKRASNTCQAGSSCTEAASKGETANQVTKRHSNTCQAESSGGGAAKDGAANQVTKRASDTCQTGGSDGEASTKGETANQATKIPSNTCQTGSSDGGASTKGETTNQATKRASNTCQAGSSDGGAVTKGETATQATKPQSNTCQAGSCGTEAAGKDETTNQATERLSNPCQAGISGGGAASKSETANQATERLSNACQAGISDSGAASEDGTANQATKSASNTCQTGSSGGGASSRAETANQATKQQSNTCQAGSSDGEAARKRETAPRTSQLCNSGGGVTTKGVTAPQVKGKAVDTSQTVSTKCEVLDSARCSSTSTSENEWTESLQQDNARLVLKWVTDMHKNVVDLAEIVNEAPYMFMAGKGLSSDYHRIKNSFSVVLHQMSVFCDALDMADPRSESANSAEKGPCNFSFAKVEHLREIWAKVAQCCSAFSEAYSNGKMIQNGRKIKQHVGKKKKKSADQLHAIMDEINDVKSRLAQWIAALQPLCTSKVRPISSTETIQPPKSPECPKTPSTSVKGVTNKSRPLADRSENGNAKSTVNPVKEGNKMRQETKTNKVPACVRLSASSRQPPKPSPTPLKDTSKEQRCSKGFENPNAQSTVHRVEADNEMHRQSPFTPQSPKLPPSPVEDTSKKNPSSERPGTLNAQLIVHRVEVDSDDKDEMSQESRANGSSFIRPSALNPQAIPFRMPSFVPRDSSSVNEQSDRNGRAANVIPPRPIFDRSSMQPTTPKWTGSTNVQQHMPRYRAPAQQTAHPQAPVQQTSHFQTPVQRTSYFQARVPQTPHFQAPVQQTPHFQAPVQQTPHFQAPVQQTPHFQARVPQTPHFQAPVQQTPHFQAPVQRTSHFQARMQQMSHFQAPAQQTPNFQAPVQQTPRYQVPVQDNSHQQFPMVYPTAPTNATLPSTVTQAAHLRGSAIWGLPTFQQADLDKDLTHPEAFVFNNSGTQSNFASITQAVGAVFGVTQFNCGGNPSQSSLACNFQKPNITPVKTGTWNAAAPLPEKVPLLSADKLASLNTSGESRSSDGYTVHVSPVKPASTPRQLFDSLRDRVSNCLSGWKSKKSQDGSPQLSATHENWRNVDVESQFCLDEKIPFVPDEGCARDETLKEIPSQGAVFSGSNERDVISTAKPHEQPQISRNIAALVPQGESSVYIQIEEDVEETFQGTSNCEAVESASNRQTEDAVASKDAKPSDQECVSSENHQDAKQIVDVMWYDNSTEDSPPAPRRRPKFSPTKLATSKAKRRLKYVDVTEQPGIMASMMQNGSGRTEVDETQDESKPNESYLITASTAVVDNEKRGDQRDSSVEDAALKVNDASPGACTELSIGCAKTQSNNVVESASADGLGNKTPLSCIDESLKDVEAKEVLTEKDLQKGINGTSANKALLPCIDESLKDVEVKELSLTKGALQRRTNGTSAKVKGGKSSQKTDSQARLTSKSRTTSSSAKQCGANAFTGKNTKTTTRVAALSGAKPAGSSSTTQPRSRHGTPNRRSRPYQYEPPNFRRSINCCCEFECDSCIRY